jgi:hypothetical protein
VLNGQLTVLLYICIANAMANDGVVSLNSSKTHPAYLTRWTLQQVHFATLVLSNQQAHFSNEESEELSSRYQALIGVFIGAGLIAKDSVDAMTKTQADDLAAAARLIDEFDIGIVKDIKPLLEMYGTKK